MTTIISLRAGTILLPGNKLRPKAFRSPRLHARQRHSGAPWHPDYVEETIALPGNKLPYHSKSEFFTVSLIDDAINMEPDFPAIVGYNGNLIVMIGFGYEIGYDALRRRNTEVATVIMAQTGEIITVFPGRPADNKIPFLKILAD